MPEGAGHVASSPFGSAGGAALGSCDTDLSSSHSGSKNAMHGHVGEIAVLTRQPRMRDSRESEETSRMHGELRASDSWSEEKAEIKFRSRIGYAWRHFCLDAPLGAGRCTSSMAELLASLASHGRAGTMTRPPPGLEQPGRQVWQAFGRGSPGNDAEARGSARSRPRLGSLEQPCETVVLVPQPATLASSGREADERGYASPRTERASQNQPYETSVPLPQAASQEQGISRLRVEGDILKRQLAEALETAGCLQEKLNEKEKQDWLMEVNSGTDSDGFTGFRMLTDSELGSATNQKRRNRNKSKAVKIKNLLADEPQNEDPRTSKQVDELAAAASALGQQERSGLADAAHAFGQLERSELADAAHALGQRERSELADAAHAMGQQERSELADAVHALGQQERSGLAVAAHALGQQERSELADAANALGQQERSELAHAAHAFGQQERSEFADAAHALGQQERSELADVTSALGQQEHSELADAASAFGLQDRSEFADDASAFGQQERSELADDASALGQQERLELADVASALGQQDCPEARVDATLVQERADQIMNKCAAKDIALGYSSDFAMRSRQRDADMKVHEIIKGFRESWKKPAGELQPLLKEAMARMLMEHELDKKEDWYLESVRVKPRSWKTWNDINELMDRHCVAGLTGHGACENAGKAQHKKRCAATARALARLRPISEAEMTALDKWLTTAAKMMPWTRELKQAVDDVQEDL